MSMQKDACLPPVPDSERSASDTKESQLQIRPKLKIRKGRDGATSGYVLTFPASATSEIVQNDCEQDTSSVVKRHRGRGDEFGCNKPRLLERLEYYLTRELATLDVLSPKYQERKLQAYKEVFNNFIEEYKTYKSLLSAIKNEYDIALVNMQEQIRELEPLRTQLVLLSEHYEKRVLNVKEQENAEIRALKQENQRLQQVIESMEEQQRGLQGQISYLKEQLAAQYLQYREEHDARRLLITNNNSGCIIQKKQPDIENNDDPVIIKFALKVCREDLAKAQVELNRLQADYGDVVPRRDYESLDHTYQENLQTLETLQLDFNRMKPEYEALIEIHQQVSTHRDTLQSELDAFRETSTPRPNWELCADIFGSKENWPDLFENESSIKKLEILMNELKSRGLKQKAFFIGLGTSNDVPIYLRYEGELKKLEFTETDVLGLIEHIWKVKESEDKKMEESSDMKEFLHQFLLKEHEEQAGEWAYSLLEGIKHYQQDDSISLFYDVLTGTVDESVYYGQMHLMSNLLKVITQSDSTKSGLLSSTQFREALRMAFPLKLDQHIEELVLAAQSETSDEGIAYQRLFTEDSNGNQSEFPSLVKKQDMAEKYQYISHLEEQLKDKGELGVEDLRNAFKAIDPTLDIPSMEWNLSKAFQTKELHTHTALLDRAVVLQRLSAADVKRAGPMTQPESTQDGQTQNA